MTLKIATWNVNSLRVRLPQVLNWLTENKPDVLALQEIKMLDSDFPFQEIQEAGYHVQCSGQKTYNGVAILTREPVHDILKDIPNLEDPQRRILSATLRDIRIINLYIPNGESVDSAKYQYKLSWLDKLNLYLEVEIEKYPKTIILGDFNIAPHEDDLHDPLDWMGKVLFTDPERAAFQQMINLGFDDCFRLHPQEEKMFSWWDYRMNSFKRNRGVRIDHILATKSLASQCVKCYIDKIPRSLERPSDHTPVVAEFIMTEKVTSD